MRVLLLDAVDRRRDRTADQLALDGHVVESVDLIDDVAQLCRFSDFDLLIVEASDDPEDAPGVIRTLRRQKITTPLVVISDPVASAVRIRALREGADDYVARPFDLEELSARMTAVVRRSNGLASDVVEVGPLILNLASRSVEIDGRPLPLTPKEYAVLEVLGLRRGRIIGREALLDQIYGSAEDRHEKIIDVYVCRLRRKLQRVRGGRDLLKTEWGRGFVLREPLALAA